MEAKHFYSTAPRSRIGDLVEEDVFDVTTTNGNESG